MDITATLQILTLLLSHLNVIDNPQFPVYLNDNGTVIEVQKDTKDTYSCWTVDNTHSVPTSDNIPIQFINTML